MQTTHPSISTDPTGTLRVLETTDLHMQLLDYDYFADRNDPSIGLIGLVDQIADLRDEASVTTVLCDNGDLLQGNPLADQVAAEWGQGQTHPMIAALNLLDYDAMTLGNHEFDYGLDYLRASLCDANFPIVSANITGRDMRALAQPFTILNRSLLCDDGQRRPIRIGITGFGPPQIADWDDGGGDTAVLVDDIVDAARQVVPKMRAAGADVIIALCHSGIGAPDHLPRMENAALPLAQVDGIDVILLGHTHETFPDPTIPNTAVTDYARGLLHGKPTVMATFCGKSLGVIDLSLQWNGAKWTMADHKSYLKHARPPNGDISALRQKIEALVAKPHAATLTTLGAPIAMTDIPIFSYFATVQPDLSQQLLARAMRRALEDALAGTAYAAWPLLAAKSSFRFGGRSGLGHYIDIPAGPITLRDVAAIFPFADTLYAVRRTGKQLRAWLERSAAHYNQMHEGIPDQPLINPQSAGYNCDTIFGLSYQIDLTKPSRFDTRGHEIDRDTARIVALEYQGKLVADDDNFIIATNSFRSQGGGGFPAIAPDDIVYRSTQSVRQHLIRYLEEIATVDTPVHPSWSFAPIPQAAGIFASAPAARQHLSGPITHVGPGKEGFDTYRIQF